MAWKNIHIGDTIIGIKGRVGFEAAGALLIINAHKMLEKHAYQMATILERPIGELYSMFLHEAQYLEPVMRDIEQFLEKFSTKCNRKGYCKLRPYSYTFR